MIKNYIILIFFITIIYIFVFCYEKKCNFIPDLDKDGFEIIETKTDVLRRLPPGYVFLDYKYTIKGCTLSTFHRDVTSSQYVFKTKHPIYTWITYDYNGIPLSVCPGSHKTTPFLFSSPQSVNCKAALFNCDLVHAGTINHTKQPRNAVQYKVAHIDDLDKLSHLEGVNKIKIDDCYNSNKITDLSYRCISLLFSYLINHIYTPYLQNHENSLLCKIIGEHRCFYNK